MDATPPAAAPRIVGPTPRTQTPSRRKAPPQYREIPRREKERRGRRKTIAPSRDSPRRVLPPVPKKSQRATAPRRSAALKRALLPPHHFRSWGWVPSALILTAARPRRLLRQRSPRLRSFGRQAYH